MPLDVSAPGIRSQVGSIGRLRYIQGVLRNRFGTPSDDMIAELRDLHEMGISLAALEAEAKMASGSFLLFWDRMCTIARQGSAND